MSASSEERKGWPLLRKQDLFGERDWDDVRKVVYSRLRRKFQRARDEDIDDAVSLAMVDLVDYWIQLKGSVVDGDPNYTFWRACKRGTWMATTFLTQEWDRTDIPLEALSPGWDGPAPSGASAPPTPTPEDVVIDQMERERFNKFMTDQLSTSDGDWLRPMLSGVTQRQLAAAEGVSRTAIAQRWRRRSAVIAAQWRAS